MVLGAPGLIPARKLVARVDDPLLGACQGCGEGMVDRVTLEVGVHKPASRGLVSVAFLGVDGADSPLSAVIVGPHEHHPAVRQRDEGNPTGGLQPQGVVTVEEVDGDHIDSALAFDADAGFFFGFADALACQGTAHLAEQFLTGLVHLFGFHAHTAHQLGQVDQLHLASGARQVKYQGVSLALVEPQGTANHLGVQGAAAGGACHDHGIAHGEVSTLRQHHHGDHHVEVAVAESLVDRFAFLVAHAPGGGGCAELAALVELVGYLAGSGNTGREHNGFAVNGVHLNGIDGVLHRSFHEFREVTLVEVTGHVFDFVEGVQFPNTHGEAGGGNEVAAFDGPAEVFLVADLFDHVTEADG